MIGPQLSPETAAGADGGGHGWRVAAICFALVAITFAVFGTTLRHDFVNYDDDVYVLNNPVVARGLTWRGIPWAFTFGEIGHWHPLTWLSHMADCELYGLKPGGPHFTNVLLQAMAATLLFLALRELTGFIWRSAFVAAVFAIHPMRVESVAWIAERKDVLGGVFFMLTLWAYARYARQPSRGRYVITAVLFGLGLMCKNTLVTMPCVFLLLDWWPLRRMERVDGESCRPAFLTLVGEKIPLFLLSAGSCVATMLVPEKIYDAQRVPFLERLGNSLVSYVIYLRQMVYPHHLYIPYVNPTHGFPIATVASAFLFLTAITWIALAWRKARPCLLAGWFWYLGVLFPAVGLVQISYYFHADRYTYLPQIGIYIALTWLAADGFARWRLPKFCAGGIMIVVVAACMFCAARQTAYWQNSETLWRHTLDCDPDNYMAHSNLALALMQKGEVDSAIAEYKRALEIHPIHSITRNNLASALLARGRADETISQEQAALRLNPDFAEAHYNLGRGWFLKGRPDDAMAEYRAALQLKPDFAAAHFALATVYRQKGNMNDAIAEYETALRLQPALGAAHNDLGTALRRLGRVDEAIAQFQKALELIPGNAAIEANLATAFLQKGAEEQAIVHFQNALQIEPADADSENNLAWLLATSGRAPVRDGKKAVQLARQANGLAGGQNPVILGTLAAALAETGQFDEAKRAAHQAMTLAQARGQAALVRQLGSQLQLYDAGQPYRRK